MKKELVFISIFFLFLSLLFFYPIFYGKVPFPGDLLVSEYNPWKSSSYLGYNPGSVPNKGQGQDVIRILYPWKYFSIHELIRGSLPFWNPYSFSGNTHFSNLQSGVFYPLNIFFFVFPFPTAWSVYIISQPLLACVFTYLFLRGIGLSKLASTFGGIVFSFSGFMTVWMEYGNLGSTFLWLPLALFMIQSYIYIPKLWKLEVIALTFIISILAGYIQLFIYLYLLSFVFALYVLYREKKLHDGRIIFFLAAAFVVPYILAAFILLPLAESFLNSARSSYTFHQLSERLIPLKNLITIVIPDFFGNPATRNYWLKGTYIERVSYVGMVPLLFVLLACIQRAQRYTVFFIIVALLSYISALDLFMVKIIHGLGIPILSTTVPSRILSVFCFALSVLAAIGFDWYINSKKNNALFTPFLFLAGIIAASWIFVIFQHESQFAITKRNLVLPSIFLFLSLFTILSGRFISKKYAIYAFLAFSIIDLLYFFHKITPFSPKAFIYPKTEVVSELQKIQGIDRTWGYGNAFLEAELSLQEKIYSPDGYDPLFSKPYGEFISLSKNGRVPSEIKRADVTIAPGFGEKDLKSNRYRKRILDLLGVKYILNKTSPARSAYADTNTFPESAYSLKWNKGEWQIYENKGALPRLFLVSSYLVYRTPAAFERLFFSDLNLSETVMTDEKVYPEPTHGQIKQVRLLTYEPTFIQAKTYADSNTLLFLSDTYYPGWKAYVDGKMQKIYRANYAFRAIPLQKGAHTVELTFIPASFTLGIVISFIACVLLLAYIIAVRNKAFLVKYL